MCVACALLPVLAALADNAFVCAPAGDADANLIMLPNGRLQCYMLMIMGGFHALCLCEFDDCFAWTAPRPIVRYGHGPWAPRWQQGANKGVPYRSPWPLRLRDGRIVVGPSRHL